MFSCLRSRKAENKKDLSGTDLQQQLIYQKNANGVSVAPAGYQLATVAQCNANLNACKAAVDGDGSWAICSLADGKISGSGYGYGVQTGSFLNQGCAVITPAPPAQLIYQKNANGVSVAPPGYQLATVAQCNANLNACKAAVDGDGSWAICSLADGKISGSGYGYGVQTGSFLNAGCAVITPAPVTNSCPNGLPVVASGQQCGAGKGCCPGNECCSQYGWCSGGSTGTASAPWCGSGCQAGYGKCGVTTCKNVVVTVQTQSWGGECGWSIPGTTLASAPGAYQDYQTYTATACVPPGPYTFKATDSYGDGWNGATFSITVDGVQVVTPTTFQSGSSFDKTFTV